MLEDHLRRQLINNSVATVSINTGQYETSLLRREERFLYNETRLCGLIWEVDNCNETAKGQHTSHNALLYSH